MAPDETVRIRVIASTRLPPTLSRLRQPNVKIQDLTLLRVCSVGNFASYRRCVGSEKISNGKRKGKGNTKNGNKYLSWAFVEAANFAIRFEPLIGRFYHRKKAKTHGVVAIKAVAHKLSRACYYVMRDAVPFDVARAFS